MNNDNSDLYTLARAKYGDEGYNQWPHIQRVVAQGQELADFRGKPLSRPELAALLLHDVAKHDKKYKNMDHGVASAIVARELLKKRLKERQIASVANAIAAHNLGKDPKTKIGELLMASDANRPDLAWYLRKSYNKMRLSGYTEQQALDNAYNRAKQGYATFKGADYVPKLYSDAYKDQIEQTELAATKLKRAQVRKLIDKYTKEHPNESIFA
jgi:HD superfamily phosphohydrolase YqeK